MTDNVITFKPRSSEGEAVDVSAKIAEVLSGVGAPEVVFLFVAGPEDYRTLALSSDEADPVGAFARARHVLDTMIATVIAGEDVDEGQPGV